jgi:hypothetical protein
MPLELEDGWERFVVDVLLRSNLQDSMHLTILAGPPEPTTVTLAVAGLVVGMLKGRLQHWRAASSTLPLSRLQITSRRRDRPRPAYAACLRSRNSYSYIQGAQLLSIAVALQRGRGRNEKTQKILLIGIYNFRSAVPLGFKYTRSIAILRNSGHTLISELKGGLFAKAQI